MTAAQNGTGQVILPPEVRSDLDTLVELHQAVLRDEHPTPNDIELAAAQRIGVAVWTKQVDPRVTDPVVGGIVACAGLVFNQALMRLSLKKAPLHHMIVRVLDRRWNVPIGTAAVSLNTKTDRITLWVNPFLVLALGAEQSTFVLGHEARHPLHGHLHLDPERATDDLFTYACEITINEHLIADLGMPMPSVDGEVVGIDPRKEYERYRDAARRAGMTPVGRDEFVGFDEDCYRALKSLPRPMRTKQASCGHADGVPDPGDGSGNGTGGGNGQPSAAGGDPTSGNGSAGGHGHSSVSGGDHARTDGTGGGLYDAPDFGGGLTSVTGDEVGELIDAVLHQAVREAMAGNEDLRSELLALGEKFPDSKVWGSVGLGRLRGEQPQTTLVAYWEQYLHRSLASRLAPSDRLEYNKKIGWWYPFFTPTGRDQEWEVAVFFDASGSISGPLVERMTELMGVVPNARVSWHSFDTEVFDLGVTEDGRGDVKPIQGGGGTSFDPIYARVAELDEEPDVVIVVTDGYAPHVVPADPSRFLWLVTAGGDAWMADHGMETIVVDETFATVAA